jgi:hypothetical protein
MIISGISLHDMISWNRERNVAGYPIDYDISLEGLVTT